MNDSLPFHSPMARNMTLYYHSEEGDDLPDYMAYHAPNNPNFIFIFIFLFLRPGIIPPEINGIPNISRHLIPHYMAPFGLIEGVDTYNPTFAKLGSIITSFIDRNQTINLGESLDAIGISSSPLVTATMESRFRLTEEQIEQARINIVNLMARDFCEEDEAFRERDATHPTVQFMNNQETSRGL